MNIFGALAVLLLFIPSQALTADTIDVIFKNNSDGLLKCEKAPTECDYTTFLRLLPGEEKEFKGFGTANKMRCYIGINTKAVTVFTYFKPSSPGVYELLKERVPCVNCKNGADSRWATIVVYPDGTTFYNKLRK